jgi:hypothetical protein
MRSLVENEGCHLIYRPYGCRSLQAQVLLLLERLELFYSVYVTLEGVYAYRIDGLTIIDMRFSKYEKAYEALLAWDQVNKEPFVSCHLIPQSA